jgi:hypothetical protein
MLRSVFSLFSSGITNWALVPTAIQNVLLKKESFDRISWNFDMCHSEFHIHYVNVNAERYCSAWTVKYDSVMNIHYNPSRNLWMSILEYCTYAWPLKLHFIYFPQQDKYGMYFKDFIKKIILKILVAQVSPKHVE